MRFLLLLLTGAAWLVSLHLSLLFGFTPAAAMARELRAANQVSHIASLPWLAFTPARYETLRVTASLVLVLSTALLVYRRRAARRAGAQLGSEVWLAARALREYLRRLSRAERLLAGGLLLAILAVRVWYLRAYPLSTDEAATFDYFVRPGPRVAASFYALPNNHILYSLLSWPLIWLLPGADPDLLLRLPSFLLGLLALPLLYLGLARLSSLRVATLATGLFQLSPMAVQYATAGRGYGLQVLCIQGLMLAVLVLLRGGQFQRLAWALLVGSSLAGLYLIPTFVYPGLSLGAALLLGLSRQRRGAAVGLLLAAGAGIGALTVLFYLPVGLLSGWLALLANPYVSRLAPGEFWAGFGPYYLRGTVSELWGQPRLAIPALLGLAALGPLGWQLLGGRLRPLGWLAWAALLGPLPLLMLQQVFAPARTLHYTLFFAALAAAVLLETGARRTRLRPAAAWLVITLLIVGYGGYRLRRELPVMATGRQQQQNYRRVYQWLAPRRPRLVYGTERFYELFLHHEARRRGQSLLPLRPLAVDSTIRRFDYLLLDRRETLPPWARARRFRLAYADAAIVIFQRLPQP